MAAEPLRHQQPTPSEQLRQSLLQPLPRIRLRSMLIAALLLGLYLWGLEGTNANPQELLEGIPNILDFIGRLFPPQLELEQRVLFGGLSVEVPIIIFSIIETVQMAIVGTTLSVLLSLPFGLLAARNVSPHPLVYQLTRVLLNANRAIPDLVFALIFVAAVGLGPFGGVLALTVGSIGFMGKLYAESIEAIDPQQVLALKATGASPLQTFFYGVIPQAAPLVASYSLLLFEHNVRAATILGLVGAGGVGFTINKYLALFQYRKLMGAMILIIITVTIIDRISDHLRKKMI